MGHASPLPLARPSGRGGVLGYPSGYAHCANANNVATPAAKPTGTAGQVGAPAQARIVSKIAMAMTDDP